MVVKNRGNSTKKNGKGKGKDTDGNTSKITLVDGTIISKDNGKDSLSSLDTETKEFLKKEGSFLERCDATLWANSTPMPLTNLFVRRPCMML